MAAACQSVVHVGYAAVTPPPRFRPCHHEAGQLVEAPALGLDPQLRARPPHGIADGGGAIAVRTERGDEAAVPPRLLLLVPLGGLRISAPRRPRALDPGSSV